MIPADLAAQLRRVNCGAGNARTGTFNCPFNRKRVIAAIFTKAGFIFEEAWSKEYLWELQQRGIAIVVSKSTQFETLTADDNIVTYGGSNIKSTAGKSPYEYRMSFDNGLWFHMQIAKLASFGAYDVTYVDEKMSIVHTASGDDAKGLTLGQVDFVPYTGADGAAQAKEALWWQELYRDEYDSEAAWVTRDLHNIRVAHLDGVNEAVITFEVVPTDAGTTLVFSVKTAADTKGIDFVSLGGLLTANLLLKKDVSGTITTVTISGSPTFDTATGNYSITVPAIDAGDKYLLQLNDATYTTGIILKGNRLFVSNVAEVTAT
jgi:hypothetical protein